MENGGRGRNPRYGSVFTRSSRTERWVSWTEPSSEAREVSVRNASRDETYTLRHRLSERQVEMLLGGGLIPVFKREIGRAHV